MLGLMTKKRHRAVVEIMKDRIDRLMFRCDEYKIALACARSELDALRPDALKYRKTLERRKELHAKAKAAREAVS